LLNGDRKFKAKKSQILWGQCRLSGSKLQCIQKWTNERSDNADYI